jgi:hypothetical protein
MIDETTATVIAAAEGARAELAAGEVRLSTGVVVHIHALARDVYDDLLERFPEPAVPVEDTGKGRLEENPSDPAYQAALREHARRINRAARFAIFTLATEVVSVPDPAWGPDGATWLEYRARSGMASGDTPLARKLDWLRFYAAKADADRDAIMVTAGRMLGVLEADALGAMKSV